jgi:signal transduction histidine kinase/ActR/RegA family two-component response regulator
MKRGAWNRFADAWETAITRRGTVRARLMRVVLVTTAIAIGLAGLAMLTHDLLVYRASWAADLSTEAAILALSTAPALEFDDHELAERNVSALQARRGVLAAALYTANGELYAYYVRGNAELPLHLRNGEFLRVHGDRAELAQPIRREGETLGFIYLEGAYDIWARVGAYLGIFVLVTLPSMAVAFLLASRLQRRITEPLDSVAGAAREIVAHRNYAVRARKTSDDEIGVLVDAFNNMLEEVEARSHELREADRRKDEFLATLAHELRNPLAPIRHAVRLLESSQITDGQRRWAREVISRQVQRMALLLDDLLDVSRITRGRLELKIESVDLKALVRAAVETVRPLLDSKQHVLSIELPEESLTLNVDPLRLSQSLSNLLTNSAKYTDPGGQISLVVRSLPAELSMSVKDNGIGFDAQSFTEMFTMFAQVKSSIDRAEGGLGIGLALVKGLIALHGGTVEAVSAGLGRGSEFVIHLPRSVVSAAGASDGASKAKASPSTGNGELKIVVADDNRDAADSMAMILTLSGYEVSVAHSGEDALEIARRTSPGVMILDIGMPGLSGYEVAAAVRREAWGSGVLLLAITGWGQAGDKERAKAAGFDHHLTKPVDLDEVEQLLQEFRVVPGES